jgi:Spy/CpxP family protein refolding chaperone
MQTTRTQNARTGLGVIAATLLLATSTLAFAGPDHANHRGKAPGAGFDPGRELSQAVQRLDLSDSQQDAIRSLFEANREDLIANREASRELRQELRTLLQEETLDQDALAELAEREGDLAEERMLLGGTLVSDILAELDEGQREELAIMREERRERQRARFSAREDRGG